MPTLELVDVALDPASAAPAAMMIAPPAPIARMPAATPAGTTGERCEKWYDGSGCAAGRGAEAEIEKHLPNRLEARAGEFAEGFRLSFSPAPAAAAAAATLTRQKIQEKDRVVHDERCVCFTLGEGFARAPR